MSPAATVLVLPVSSIRSLIDLLGEVTHACVFISLHVLVVEKIVAYALRRTSSNIKTRNKSHAKSDTDDETIIKVRK